MARDDKASTDTNMLSGVRVLDLSRVLAGPWCSQGLGDLGADVLKIEQPAAGDETRAWGPPDMAGVSAYFACANRNKRSLAVDLKAPEGARLVARLAQHADVLIENFRAGSLARFGLDYASLAARNPGLVYCSISGYGHTGTRSQRPGYDFVIQGESGLMSVTGEPGRSPVKVGVAVSDLTAGLYATQSILAALFAREKTGTGRFIDVALFDCQVAALANVASSFLATDTLPRRFGNAHASVVPYQVFDARDLPFVLAVGNNRQFERLTRDVLGRGDLAEDPAYMSNGARVRHREALTRQLADVFAREPRAHWLERLSEADIPAGPINTVAEALASGQAHGRDMITTVESPSGAFRLVSYPVAFDGVKPSPRTPPPELGAGGQEAVAEWLGCGDDEIKRLRRQRAFT